jgi:PAS domain S-box-containing protein
MNTTETMAQSGDARDLQSAILASEIRYRRLFEAARDGILILDPETRKITDSNPYMTELLGYPREELLGKELWQIGLLKDEEANQAAFRELRQNNYVRYEDLPLQSKSGTSHQVEFVSNIYEENGRKVIQSNIRDITERKRNEEALLQAKDEISRHAVHLEQVVAERTSQLRETVGELEAFSYSVSHDMRAPLRAMQSYAQFLVDDYSSKLDERGINYLQRIMRSSIRLDSLIKDVLSYTKILHTRLPTKRVDLDRLVRDIIETYHIDEPVEPQIVIKGNLPEVLGNEALLTRCNERRSMEAFSAKVSWVIPRSLRRRWTLRPITTCGFNLATRRSYPSKAGLRAVVYAAFILVPELPPVRNYSFAGSRS